MRKMEHSEPLADPNNNSAVGAEKCEKYSLRPRAALKRDDDEEDSEGWKPRAKNKKRAKQKSAPLSKYRRKTANARERCRMREINEAFETLRRVLPHLSAPQVDANEKLTKISTLRLAMKYIATLSRMLQDADVESSDESFSPSSASSSHSSRTFSERSLGDFYSDQLLSPADHFESLQLHYLSQDHLSQDHRMLPYSHLEASRTPSLDDLPSLASLPLSDEFGISDFVRADDCDVKLDSLPEITFDDSEYALDSLISSV